MVTVTTVGLTHPTTSGSGGSAAAPSTCGLCQSLHTRIRVIRWILPPLQPRRIKILRQLENEVDDIQKGKLSTQSTDFDAEVCIHSMDEVSEL